MKRLGLFTLLALMTMSAAWGYLLALTIHVVGR